MMHGQTQIKFPIILCWILTPVTDVGARYKILRPYRIKFFRYDFIANIDLLDENFSGEIRIVQWYLYW